MTAAYRLKGIGWLGAVAALILAFYLVSLQVAAERKKLEAVNGRIESAERDIRALETEFDTRANLAQLEKWNGDTLALAAPLPAQFLPDEAALAGFDVNGGSATGAGIQTAALVVPAAPTILAPPVAATAAPAVTQVAAALPQAKPAVIPTVTRVAAIAKSAPMEAKLAAAAPDAAAVAKVRPQAVAMLDSKLLSDSTLGDLLSNARREARLR